MLDPRRRCARYPPQRGPAMQPGTVTSSFDRPRTAGLFVEGGGLRAAFSAGALGELSGPGGLRFDDVLAVSSGAPAAAYLVAGQMDDSLTIWRDHCHGDKLM